MNERTKAQQHKTTPPMFTALQNGIILQRKCACGQHTVAGGECAECRTKRLQRKSAGRSEPESVPPIVHEVLRSSGQPLDTETRAFMEPRFGQDFSQVRVHTDAKAAESAWAVNALAYTVGHDIVFGDGQFSPQTVSGRKLMAHELTHVVQQADYSQVTGELRVNEAGSQFEREVNQFAKVTEPTSVDVRLSKALRPHIARQCDPAWATLEWSQRIRNARSLAGNARDRCFIELIREAIGTSSTIHLGTNNEGTLQDATTANAYTEYGSIASPTINFDANLNSKTGQANRDAVTYCQPRGDNVDIFVVFGLGSLNEGGLVYTQKVLAHEEVHVRQCSIQTAVGQPLTISSNEELEAFAETFTRFFIDLWRVSNTPPCEMTISDLFLGMFQNYASADSNAQDSAFESIKTFHEVRIQPDACNRTKFRIWLQDVMNRRPSTDALVIRINGLPGLGLIRGTGVAIHMPCPTPCS